MKAKNTESNLVSRVKKAGRNAAFAAALAGAAISAGGCESSTGYYGYTFRQIKEAKDSVRKEHTDERKTIFRTEMEQVISSIDDIISRIDERVYSWNMAPEVKYAYNRMVVNLLGMQNDLYVSLMLNVCDPDLSDIMRIGQLSRQADNIIAYFNEENEEVRRKGVKCSDAEDGYNSESIDLWVPDHSESNEDGVMDDRERIRQNQERELKKASESQSSELNDEGIKNKAYWEAKGFIDKTRYGLQLKIVEDFEGGCISPEGKDTGKIAELYRSVCEYNINKILFDIPLIDRLLLSMTFKKVRDGWESIKENLVNEKGSGTRIHNPGQVKNELVELINRTERESRYGEKLKQYATPIIAAAMKSLGDINYDQGEHDIAIRFYQISKSILVDNAPLGEVVSGNLSE